MDLITRRNIATILAAAAGVICIFTIVSLIIGGCRSVWTWGKTLFFFVTVTIPFGREIGSYWTDSHDSAPKKRYSWGLKGLDDPNGYRFIPTGFSFLALTLLIAGGVFLEMDYSAPFWGVLFLLGLVFSIVAVAFMIWTGCKIAKHNKQ